MTVKVKQVNIPKLQIFGMCRINRSILLAFCAWYFA